MVPSSAFRSSPSAREWAVALGVAFGVCLGGCDWIKSILPVSKRGAPASAIGDARIQGLAEILSEMYRVIFGASPEKAEFASLLNSMEQGASLEGVYNGLTHSARYRRMELQNSGSTPQALERFVELLSEFQREQGNPAVYDETAAGPLPIYGGDEAVSVQSFAGPGKAAVPDYRKVFQSASIFTLKRVLGDEALKVIAIKRARRENLAAWYAGVAYALADKGVDFGLPLRNKKDDAFHRQWAMSASEDALVWEVLNRVHRTLNHAQSAGVGAGEVK